MANKFLVNGKPIVECRLSMPKIGAWLANDLLIDSDEGFNIGDSVTIDFLDTIFKGTVLDTGIFQGFQRCTVIGGTGRLPEYLESACYNSIPVGQIIRDIARKTGHQVSTTSDQNVLNNNLVGWNILKMQASLALEKVLQITNSIWRILPDGTLWVGPEKYSAVNPEDYLVIEKFPEEARWSIYNEDTLLQPLTSLSGNDIQQVEYFLFEENLNISVTFTLNFADSIDALTNQNDNTLYNSIYRCSVVKQKQDDGTLDLTPNPYNEVIKNGFTDVPIIYPFPGMKIEVPSGTICYVQFANGDPQYPRVFAWEDQVATNGIKVHFIHDGAEQPAARKGDGINAGKLSFQPGMSGAVLLYNGNPVTAAVDITGSITAGSNQVGIGG